MSNTEDTEKLRTLKEDKKYSNKTHPHSSLTERIIGLAIKVHKELGPGFREKYYQRALYIELQRNSLLFDREKRINVWYDKVLIGYHVVDFIVEKKVMVELKSMKAVTDVEVGQLSKYLGLSGCEVGLILNFGRATLEIKRVAKLNSSV